MSLVHNEQTKLLANALDRASTACMVLGVVSPLASFGSVGDLPYTSWSFIFSTLCWFLAAIALHLAARTILGRLRS